MIQSIGSSVSISSNRDRHAFDSHIFNSFSGLGHPPCGMKELPEASIQEETLGFEAADANLTTSELGQCFAEIARSSCKYAIHKSHIVGMVWQGILCECIAVSSWNAFFFGKETKDLGEEENVYQSYRT